MPAPTTCGMPLSGARAPSPQSTRPAAMRPLGPWPSGINDLGQVVGTYVDTSGARHGFLLSKGVYTTLDVPDAAFTVAEGINNAGQIVGLYLGADGNVYGFSYTNGVYTTVGIPAITDTEVYSINAKSEIAGTYWDADDVTHGFIGKRIR